MPSACSPSFLFHLTERILRRFLIVSDTSGANYGVQLRHEARYDAMVGHYSYRDQGRPGMDLAADFPAAEFAVTNLMPPVLLNWESWALVILRLTLVPSAFFRLASFRLACFPGDLCLGSVCLGYPKRSQTSPV